MQQNNKKNRPNKQLRCFQSMKKEMQKEQRYSVLYREDMHQDGCRRKSVEVGQRNVLFV